MNCTMFLLESGGVARCCGCGYRNATLTSHCGNCGYRLLARAWVDMKVRPLVKLEPLEGARP